MNRLTAAPPAESDEKIIMEYWYPESGVFPLHGHARPHGRQGVPDAQHIAFLEIFAHIFRALGQRNDAVGIGLAPGKQGQQDADGKEEAMFHGETIVGK